ncbi:MAG: phosphatase PAP2 family protein [Leptospiraceae bacterium]|nr:phosphatase PAP2 family protein [Leptospiraceae bacterium]
MKDFIRSVDIKLAEYIHKNIKNDKLDKLFSRINRGEVMAFLVIPALFLSEIPNPFLALFYTAFFAFLNDRSVLIIKKKISRKRPSLKIMGKENNHPDLNHSFPSAHAANSIIVAILLVILFQQTYLLFVLAFIAGVGRLLTLHHFLSDVVGGWCIGIFSGVLGIAFYIYVLKNFI